MLKNACILDLEGQYKIWLACMSKAEIYKSFLNHVVRKNLFRVWDRYKNLLERKTSLWLSPAEAESLRISPMDMDFSQ